MFIEELAYSFHLGNDKNKTKKARQVARESKTGTTSFNNNGIQNTQTLSKADRHNYRKYDDNQDDIVIIKVVQVSLMMLRIYIKESLKKRE